MINNSDNDDDLCLSSSPSGVEWVYGSNGRPLPPPTNPRRSKKMRTIILVSCTFFLVAVSVFLATFFSLRNSSKSNDGTATTTAASTTSETSTLPTSPSPISSPIVARETIGPSTFTPSSAPVVLEYTRMGSIDVIESIPHDTDAYTQGLEVISYQKLGLDHLNSTTTSNNDSTGTGVSTSSYFLESTGRYGKSTIRLVEVATGNVHHQLSLDDSYFGEGCTYYLHEMTGNNSSSSSNTVVLRVVQITWREGIGFVYETSLDDPPADLVLVGSFEIDTVSGEGWGISYLPHRNQFVVSDGTEFLHFWELWDDVEADGNFVFELVDTIAVTRRFDADNEDWSPLEDINELEWDPYNYNGETILANVWTEEYIVRIRLSDGKVMNQYELPGQYVPSGDVDVMNGIAAVLDSSSTLTNNEFWVTGKLWPQMYRVRLVDDIE